jgi:KaiC/GvpD/RAD55 family RecA-like ATPase
MKQYRTGILAIDSQLNGGIPAGSVVTILEDPGAGADIFSYHFAVEGLRSGENVFYLSTDDSIEEIKESINLYFGELDQDLWENMTILSLLSPYVGEKTDEDDARSFLRRTIYDPLNGLKTILDHETFNRVIINNITYFLENYQLSDVISLLVNFSRYAKVKESVFLILMTKGMFDSKIENTIKHYSSGVIELTLREVENEVQRRLKITKLKRVLVPKTILRYELTDKGIRMESVMRVL